MRRSDLARKTVAGPAPARARAMGVVAARAAAAAAVLMLGVALVAPGALPALANYHQEMASPPQASSQPGSTRALQTQLQTAATHAGVASRSQALSSVTLHLGHALNCLEGPKGTHFDASWGNVCEGQGDGILNDARSAGSYGRIGALLEAADLIAVQGVRQTDLASAQLAAKAVAQLLQLALDAVK